MIDEPVTTARLVRETWNLAKALGWFVPGWTLVLTIVSVSLETAGYPNGATIGVSVLMIVAQRAAVLSGLVAGGHDQADVSLNFVELIVLQFLTVVAYGVGFLLLVVPFLILLVRWWVAVPLMATRRVGPTDALAVGWAMTKGYALPIAGLAALLFGAMAISLFGSIAMTGVDLDLEPLSATNLVVELALNGFSLLLTLSSVATFLAIRPAHDRLSEVFA